MHWKKAAMVVGWTLLAAFDARAFASWGLRAAAREGDLATVTRLVRAGDDPSGDTGEPSPLMEATMNGHLDVMAFLVKAGAKLTTRDQNGETALHWAARHAQVAAALWLLEQGADAKAAGHLDEPVLVVAIESGLEPLVAKLLERGADPNAAGQVGWTPLAGAVLRDRVGIARRLFAAGARLETAVWAGEQAIQMAAEGELALLTLVLEHGGDVEAGAETGRTPLVIAARAGKVEHVQALLAAGAKPDALAGLAYVAAAEAGTRMVLDELAPLTRCTPEVFGAAARAGYAPGVERCLGAGMAAGIGLPFAAAGGHVEVMKRLVGAGADNFVAAWREGAFAGHVEVARYLMDKGVDPDVRGQGMTALMQAARDGNVAMIDLLIARGADPRLVDPVGRNARAHFEDMLATLQAGVEEARQYRSATPGQRARAAYDALNAQAPAIRARLPLASERP